MASEKLYRNTLVTERTYKGLNRRSYGYEKVKNFAIFTIFKIIPREATVLYPDSCLL